MSYAVIRRFRSEQFRQRKRVGSLVSGPPCGPDRPGAAESCGLTEAASNVCPLTSVTPVRNNKIDPEMERVMRLVGRGRAVHIIHDQNAKRQLFGCKVKSKLLLDRGEERRAVGVLCGPVQREVITPFQSGAVDNRPIQMEEGA